MQTSKRHLRGTMSLHFFRLSIIKLECNVFSFVSQTEQGPGESSGRASENSSSSGVEGEILQKSACTQLAISKYLLGE